MIEKINLADKFSQFNDQWSPHIVAELNGQHVKLAKIEGEFIWHKHDDEDELFMVIAGRLLMRFRDGDVWLEAGEIIVVPRGVEHLPIAEGETQIMLFEPVGTLNTGDADSDRTKAAEWL